MTVAAAERKERPILFNTEMVQAVLSGRKTQTRRVIKTQSLIGKAGEINTGGMTKAMWIKVNKELPESFGVKYFCPYGKPGDRLWVRETWWQLNNTEPRGEYIYKADLPESEGKWKPSIFMPRSACRIILEVVNIRVERVRDITPRDCMAEGIKGTGKNFDIVPKDGWKYSFQKLWNSINESRGYGWEKNPFVWVVEFKKLENANG